MVVAFVNSSQTGTTDAFVTSVAVPVPASAAANHIAIVAIEQWESTNPTVTAPSGFTALTTLISGNQKLKPFWKRLTGADTGNYTFSWTGSQWSMGHCILISGGITTGDPVEATNTATAASGTSIPSTSVTTATEPFLAHHVANENAATATPPTNYTETRDGDYLHSNYRIPATTGSHTASGGITSADTLILAYLIAIKPESGAGSQTVVVPVLSTSSTIFNPQIIQLVSVPTISAPSVIPNPEIDQIINNSVISAPSAILNPTITVGAVSVLVPVINAPSSVFAPAIPVAGGSVKSKPGAEYFQMWFLE